MSFEVPQRRQAIGLGTYARVDAAVLSEGCRGVPAATPYWCNSPRRGGVRKSVQESGSKRQRSTCRTGPPDEQDQRQRGGNRLREADGKGGEQRPDGMVTVSMVGETLCLSLYPRLMSILSDTDDLDPHLRSIGWLIKRMDELYDARRRAEQASFSAEEDYLNLNSGSRKLLSFPVFAYKHFKNRHGIKHMVRSVCLELVCNVQIYRKTRPEVEVFARFMEEFYGQKELCFFLDLREEAHRVTRVGARWAAVMSERTSLPAEVTQDVWMTLPDCVRVAKGVFIDATTLYFRDLIATVSDQGDWPKQALSRKGARPTVASAGGQEDHFYRPHDPSPGIRGMPSLPQLSPRPLPNCIFSPSPSGSPLAGVEGNGSGGGRHVQHLVTPIDVQHDRGSSPTLASLQSAPTTRQGQQQYQRQQQQQPQEGLQPPPPPQQQQQLQGQQQTVMDHPGSLEWGRRGVQRRRSDGGRGNGSDGSSPDTSTVLEWGLSGLLSFLKGDARSEERGDGGIRQGRNNAQDAWSAFSPASSSRSHPSGLTRSEARSSSLPTPPPSASASASVPENTGWRQRTTDERAKAETRAADDDNNSARNRGSGGGGGVGRAVSRPARQATGGGSVSPCLAAVAESRAEDDHSTGFATAKEGCSGGGSCSRVAPTSDEREEGVPGAQRPLQLYQEHPSSAGWGVTATPASPASLVDRSPCPVGGPLRALSRLALLERLGRPRSGSRSTSPERHSQSRHERHPTTSTAQKALPGTGKNQTKKTVAGVANGIETSTGAQPSSDGRGDRGDEEARRATTVVLDDKRPGAAAAAAAARNNGVVNNAKDEHLQSEGHFQDGGEFSHAVASTATDWLASFEKKFMPCLVAKARAGPDVASAASVGKPGGMASVDASRDSGIGGPASTDGTLLPAPIARVLHEEVFRALAPRRRDLDIVERVSPDLLQSAVGKSFWMLEDAVFTAAAHSRVLSNMGRLLEERGYPNEALLCFQEASTADPASPEAHCCMAGNIQRRGDLDGAAFCFEAALARDGSYSSAWYGLGQVKSAQGKHADAVEAFSRWLQGVREGAGGCSSGVPLAEKNGEGGDAGFMAKGLVQLGDAYMKLGQDKHAQSAYERAISVDESCSEAHFQLGSLLQTTCKYQHELAPPSVPTQRYSCPEPKLQNPISPCL